MKGDYIMYEKFINNKISVFVKIRSDNYLEYKGILVDENENSISCKTRA